MMPYIDPDRMDPHWDLSQRGLSWREMTLGDLFAGRWTRARRKAFRLAYRHSNRHSDDTHLMCLVTGPSEPRR
jgi:hypothetical protein